MPSSAAERMRRSYQRAKRGLACLTIEVDLVELSQALIDEGVLASEDEDDRAAIAVAVQEVLQGLIVLTRKRYEFREVL
jgi:hypothetical protein